jgi:predicted helicase
MLNNYLNNLQNTINQGDAREESFYGHLERLLLDFAEAKKLNTPHITILPKKTEAGNPDFRIWDGENHVTGYIEAKAPAVAHLDRIEETEQLKRYRETFPNVILTNFYEFRLYRNGELIKTVAIGRASLALKLQTTPPAENTKDFDDLMESFFSFNIPVVRNSVALAHELAKRTRFLKDEVVAIELAEAESRGQNALLGFYEAFKTYLIQTITQKQFADLYSQTITYGLFAARTRAKNGFNRRLAFDYIPNTIGILRDVFRFISLGDPPKSMEVIIDDIAEVLNLADVKQILHDYYHEGKGDDPIIHFYETFLTEYDPSIREKRGVYYTPEPVVRFIVRSVHRVLQSHFDIADGLAGSGVTLLDPAGGTLAFPAEALRIAVNTYIEKYGAGAKIRFIKEQILPNFFAFELMMAPYAIGHLKMSFMLEELDYRLQDDERFNLYLTNTLEMEEIQQIRIPGLSSLSEESRKAGQVKNRQNILVIIGNPPYSGISMNTNQWTERLLKQNIDGAQSYYEADGKPLGEKKLWLQDDYVKFLRFAQWKIHKAGRGIVVMITNHSYLDNPTFRGMRQSLMKTFNEIYIVDLHGNSLKKETTPEGGKDQNVFEIRQGTAIAIFVKNSSKKTCKVFHTDLYGMREEKYKWLDEALFRQKLYTAIKPAKPWYFFIPRDTLKINHYLKWKAIQEIFPVNVTGIVTARDNLAIAYTKKSLKSKIKMYRNLIIDDDTIRNTFGVNDNYQWKISEQRRLFIKEKNWEDHIKEILYRPFDKRFICYQENIVFRQRHDLMQHIIDKKNITLCFTRQYSGDHGYNHFLVSEYMVDNRTFFSAKGIIQQAPLYLYQSKKPKKRFPQTMMVFEPEPVYETKVPNIDRDFRQKLNTQYGREITPEEILNYVYAVFFSKSYRDKYDAFLRIDFPRVPFTADVETFDRAAKIGRRLVDLHLLKDAVFKKIKSKFRIEDADSGSDLVEKVVYDQAAQKVYINRHCYFDGITSEMWEYRIGGYQVLKKYLADRAKAKTDIGDPGIYCKIATAIHHTIQIQDEMDMIYPEIENRTIDFEL